jgi:hypothetical protein
MLWFLKPLLQSEREAARQYQRMALATAIIVVMRQQEFPSEAIDVFERNVGGIRDQSVDTALAWARKYNKADIIDENTLWAAAAAFADNAAKEIKTK